MDRTRGNQRETDLQQHLYISVNGPCSRMCYFAICVRACVCTDLVVKIRKATGDGKEQGTCTHASMDAPSDTSSGLRIRTKA